MNILNTMPLSHCHNLLVDSMFNTCCAMGILSTREFEVLTENGIGFIDLVASDGITTVAVEVERTNRRIENDLAKAASISVDLLLIVVPNPQVKRLVKKRLRQLRHRKNVRTFVACLPEAITRLRDCFSVQL